MPNAACRASAGAAGLTRRQRFAAIYFCGTWILHWGFRINPRPADSSAQIGENNDRAGTAELTGAFAGVGALALPAASSPDAARLVSLPPGLRSVHAGGRATPGGARLAVHTVP